MRGAPASLIELGKLGTANQVYIPWMQATYVMAAKKEALQYLPAGADVNALTYAQLKDWARTSRTRRASARSAFPPVPRD